MKIPSFIALTLCACTVPVLADPETTSLVSLDHWSNLGEWSMANAVSGSTTEKKWKSVTDGNGILFNGKAGKTTNLLSKTQHGDVKIKVEFMIPKASNSGIYFMERYEVQILDSFGKADEALQHGDCGGIYQRWNESEPDKNKKGFEGTKPSTNASTAPGTWQCFKISFRAPRFDASGAKTENARFVKVEHNGVVIHEDVEVTGPTRGGKGGNEVPKAGFIIQGDHGPVAIRKFEVSEADFE